MIFPKNFGEFKLWLLRQLPMWDYVCPKCESHLEEGQHVCHVCAELVKVPIRVPPRVLKDRKALDEYVHRNIMPWLSPSEYAYLAQYFTEIFSDGFESGNFSAWTGTLGTPTVQGTYVHHGSYAMQITAPDYHAYKTITAATSLYTRLYFRLATVPTGTDQIYVLWFGAGTTWVVGVKILAATLTLRHYYDASHAHDYSKTWATGTWYCLELYWLDAASGHMSVWLDGSLVIDLSEATSTAPSITTVTAGDRYGVGTYTTQIDCVVVADAYIGPEAAGGLSIPVAMRTYRNMRI